MKEFHRRDFANRTGLAQAWTVKSADRLFTVSQDTIKGRKLLPKDVGRERGYYIHPYNPFISLEGEGDVEWTYIQTIHFP